MKNTLGASAGLPHVQMTTRYKKKLEAGGKFGKFRVVSRHPFETFTETWTHDFVVEYLAFLRPHFNDETWSQEFIIEYLGFFKVPFHDATWG